MKRYRASICGLVVLGIFSEVCTWGITATNGIAEAYSADSAASIAVVRQVQQWLHGPVQVVIRNEVNGKTASFESKPNPTPADATATTHPLDTLGLSVAERYSPTDHGMAWDLEFSGQGARVGHEVTIELPMLTDRQQVFTPSERGVMTLRPIRRSRRWNTEKTATATDDAMCCR